mmetsp:Transcript_6456/g.11864  ORF Transcript_6456/g.11864 Transcript_6456/m.11864 type:complete len:90 (-) Transcript_6456:161-430(-)
MAVLVKCQGVTAKGRKWKTESQRKLLFITGAASQRATLISVLFSPDQKMLEIIFECCSGFSLCFLLAAVEENKRIASKESYRYCTTEEA